MPWVPYCPEIGSPAKRPPSVKLVQMTVRVLLHAASRSVVKALREGKIRGLGAQDRGGTVWVTGRIRGEQLAVLLGTPALPVILASEPLAVSVMHKAHREDHRRGPRDAAARSRRSMWIVSASRLAKTTVGRCHECKYMDRRMESQAMGQLPQERLEVVSPFNATALDLFGPFWVKDTAKGRRRFKCWIVLYVCMGSKAVCLLPVPGYGTEEFMTTHRIFTGLVRKTQDSLHGPRTLSGQGGRDPRLGRDRRQDGRPRHRMETYGQGLFLAERTGGACHPFRQAHPPPRATSRRKRSTTTSLGAVLAVAAAVLNARPLSLRVSPEGGLPRAVPSGYTVRKSQSGPRPHLQGPEFHVGHGPRHRDQEHVRKASPNCPCLETKVDVRGCFPTWWLAQSGARR